MSLDTQINNVESALAHINGLEVYLNELKDDMIEMNKKNILVQEEYLKMQEIKKVIDNDKETLNNIITYEPWYNKIITFISGLVTGIATSFIASILFEKYKRYKELKN